jgi:hypothetical protein
MPKNHNNPPTESQKKTLKSKKYYVNPRREREGEREREEILP